VELCSKPGLRKILYSTSTVDNSDDVLATFTVSVRENFLREITNLVLKACSVAQQRRTIIQATKIMGNYSVASLLGGRHLRDRTTGAPRSASRRCHSLLVELFICGLWNARGGCHVSPLADTQRPTGFSDDNNAPPHLSNQYDALSTPVCISLPETFHCRGNP